MHAFTYHGPKNGVWEEKPMPLIQKPTDAIVRITKTTICGTDLHILKGDLPEVTAGRILGHEGIGVITEVGDAVASFKIGDNVLISCITSCGRCGRCKTGMYSHCEDGGWLLGHLIDGTQAEFARIPHADNSLYHSPATVNPEALVMLSDILPTGYECGVISGTVKPADTVAIIGAGPIGLAAMLTARFYSPAEIIMVDLDESRLAVAKSLGATKIINSQDGKAVEKIMQATNNRGVDVAIEAVGSRATFDICQFILAPGGHLANVGVHGEKVDLHLEILWSRNITLTTRLVDTVTTPLLLKSVIAGKLLPEQLITHRFKLSEIARAYDVFSHASREHALKIVLSN